MSTGLASKNRSLLSWVVVARDRLVAVRRTFRKNLLTIGAAVHARGATELRANRAEERYQQASEKLATSREEIRLLDAITKNLQISSTDAELGRLAIERLGNCVPAEAFAIHFLPAITDEDASSGVQTRPLFLASDNCPVDEEQFVELIAQQRLSAMAGAYAVDLRSTQGQSGNISAVRQLLVTPFADGDHVFGWLAAFNHRHDELFGAAETDFLASLGRLFSIHCGNRTLYRQQSELLHSIVRALVSAIDAKDQYTSGHSDRVARLAVRIALELRCSPQVITTIYLAGLLHDVGKIGIDDQVLRKAGGLTDAEFAHIQEHPELGYKILADLKQLSEVLPAVLHHHERWDGRGYPAQLSGEEIPRIARIMAVADSYDAMTSDRPYRSSMAEAKVDEIFREGSGKYWDPEVVAAFFKAKDDIRAISQRERT